MGCSHLANLYSDGKGGDQDVDRAEELYQAECNAGSGYACNQLAWLLCHDQGRCNERSEALARRANGLGHGRTAYILDTLAYVLCERGKHDEGNAMYERACMESRNRGLCGKSCESQ